MKFLVGDNPFHGISHLSQERARLRSVDESASDVSYASQLVKTSVENGASGFMFSVSETTLSILKELGQSCKPDLYAIIPYAYEYVRLAAQTGGISGLAKKVFRQVAFSKSILMAASNLGGLIKADPASFLDTYVVYEIARIKSAAGKDVRLKSILLHEIITDMALAYKMDWLFTSYIEFMLEHKMRPGFETRNFAYLVNKFRDWQIDFENVTIAAPFNKVGFQMNPSKIACEEALGNAAGSEIIVMSLFAAGYLKPQEALGYLKTLRNVEGVVVGVSKKRQAEETFNLFRKTLV
jgi:hypothetical protein